jgi:TRAP-type C4-dicarboxylate transport system permease small subunit
VTAPGPRAPLLRRFIDRLDEALNVVACVALALMLLAVVLQVISRYALNDPIEGVIGISEQFIMPLVVFLTLSWVHMHDGHIRVPLLWDRFAPRARRWVGAFVNAGGALLFGAITWAVGSEALLAWQMKYDTSGDISVPLYLALLIPTFGSALLTLRLAGSVLWRPPADGAPRAAISES